MVGIGAGGAADFSATNPDLSAQGTTAAGSGAAKIGTFDEFGNSASTNVQDVLDDLDQTITDNVVSFVAPAFTLGTSNAVGSSGNAVDSDATIALFDATAPTTIQPDDAAATGSAAVAARRDHTHAIVTAAPVAVGSANSEGTSTSFARADHVHDLDPDGAALKWGRSSIADASSSLAVSFTTAFTSACDQVNVTVENVTDGSPLHFTVQITARATTGFTVTLSGNTDTANYDVSWIAYGS